MTDKKQTSELSDKISDWLSTEGLVLEYNTMHGLQNIGLNAQLGTHIVSKEGKSREIDVSAIVGSSDSIMKQSPVSILVCCECKYSVDRPWVMMKSGQKLSTAEAWDCLPHSTATHELGEMLPKLPQRVESLWHFQPEAEYGHTILQAFLGNKKDGREKSRDYAFEALQKVANASWDWVLESERETPDDEVPPYFSLVAIPVLIIEGRLFEAWCPDGGTAFEVNEVPFGRLCWLGLGSGTLIDVVTSQGLPEWSARLKETIDSLIEIDSNLPKRRR